MLHSYFVIIQEKRGLGASDGTFKYTEYFKCKRDCAVFVAMDKLSNPNGEPTNKTVQPHPSQKQDDPLKLGDMVTFFDEQDRPMKGVVRWIGRNISQLSSGAKVVGIETVSGYIFTTCLAIFNDNNQNFENYKYSQGL